MAASKSEPRDNSMNFSIDEPMPILAHLRVLKRRVLSSMLLLIAFFVAVFLCFNPILAWILHPLHQASPETFASTANWLYSRTIFEGLSTKLLVSLQLAFALSLPLHFVNLFSFLLPALKKSEKNLLVIVFFLGLLLAGISLWYGYGYILPLSVRFLVSNDLIPERVSVLLNYRDNVSYLIRFLVATLIIFQIPLMLDVALYFRLLTRRVVWKSFRYVVLVDFIFSAVISPPDIMSQIALALPLLLLLLLALGVARICRFGG